MTVQIDSMPLAAMYAHALEAFPYECCGFFYGSIQEDRIRVREYQPVPNSKEGDQRRRFEVAPEEYMRAERHALLTDTELLGVYHSHPLHPAIPSEHDLKSALPNFSYLIVTVEEGLICALRSWRLDESRQFIEEPIDTISIKPLYQTFKN